MIQLDLFNASWISALALPERIPCIGLYWDFAWLIAAGHKPLETRGRAWPYPPGWLVIYSTKDRGGLKKRPVFPEGVTLPPLAEIPRQALTCLVWIAGSRPLVPADREAACFYEAGLHAWQITAVHRFKRPVLLVDSGMKSGPQSIVYLARDVVEHALLAT